MSLIRTHIINKLYPLVALLYRSSPAASWPFLLRLLGIADVSYQKRFYTLSRIIDSVKDDSYAIAECGVYRGKTLLGLAHRLHRRGLKVKLFGFDSFEGFPEPAPEDALLDGSYHSLTRKGVFSDTRYEELAAKVKALGYADDVTLVKGYFEKTLDGFKDLRFSVVHLDCDLYQSYLTCLEFFYPRVIAGGYIVFDEYDFSAPVYPGAQKAIDSFLATKPEKITRFSEATTARYFIRKQQAPLRAR